MAAALRNNLDDWATIMPVGTGSKTGGLFAEGRGQNTTTAAPGFAPSSDTVPGAPAQQPKPVQPTPKVGENDLMGGPNMQKTGDIAPGFAPPNNSATPIAPTQTNNNQTKAGPGLSLMDQQTTWNATTGQVTDDERVSEQMTKLLGANSAYVDQARQRAYQRANERGLSNSSMAMQAGEEAAIAQALPIAQQDAGTYLNQSQRNQQASNAAGSQNAQVGMGLKQLSENARQADNSTDLQAQSLMEQARQYDTGVKLEDKKIAEAARQEDNRQLAQISMFNKETASKENMAQLDAATKTYLANTEAKYKTQMQSSASAAQMFQEYTQAVNAVLNNDKLDAPNKQAALDLLGKNLDEGMRLMSHIGNINLGNFTFTGTNGNAGVGSPAPAPGAPGAPAPAPNVGQPTPGAPAPEVQGPAATNPGQNPSRYPGEYFWNGQRWVPEIVGGGGDA